MKKNLMRKFIGLSLLGILTLSAQAQTDVSFGSLYGSNRDTNPTLLSGTEYFWICLDNDPAQPGNGTHSYFISSDINSLSGPLWGGFDVTSKNSIESAITNIYGNNFEAILSDFSGAGAARDFQRSVWALVHSRENDMWSGTLTTSDIAAINSWWGTPDGFDYMLNTALTETDSLATVYYGSPASDPNLQPVMFVSIIPEPSAVLMLGGGLMVLAVRRRRLVG